MSRLSAAFAADGDLNDLEESYLRRISGASTPELALALSSSPLTEDAAVTELEIDILKKIQRYHPRLQAAIVSHAPQSAAPFLSGSVLSDQEAEALSALHSVFGIEAFYDAWLLDRLEINEIQAVLRLLQSYDPFSTVYGPTDDTDSQDALIERTFDQFSVGPAGSCVYCQGQHYFTNGDSPEDVLAYKSAVTWDVVLRIKLLHLVHASTVQFRNLSPCNIRDYSKPELLVMSPNYMHGLDPRDQPSKIPLGPLAYHSSAHTFIHSVKVDDHIVKAIAEPWFGADADKGTIRLAVGEIFSPFTVATQVIAQGGPIERSRAGCLEAVRRIVDWDRHRYVHFTGMFEQSISPFAATVFPENPLFPPLWVMLLTNEAGGQDKAQRLIDLMRSLNIPAARHGWGSIGSKEGDIPIEAKFPGGGCGTAGTGQGTYFCYHSNDGVIIPPWNVHLDRNVGFSTADMLAPIEHILQRYDPGCSIQAEPLKIPYVWFRELTGVVYRPIISCDSSVVHRPLNVAFADDLASELDSVFKPVIEAATDTNVEAAPLNVTGTKSCLRGDRSYYDPEFNTLTLMEDELAELLRKEAAVVEEVGEDLIRLKIDLLGRTTTVSIHSRHRIHVIFSYCE